MTRRPKLAEHELYGYQVVLIDTRPTVPVFHKPGVSQDGEASTPCGEWRSVTYGARKRVKTRGFALDPRHALKFARPCKVCYHGGLPEHLDVEDES